MTNSLWGVVVVVVAAVVAVVAVVVESVVLYKMLCTSGRWLPGRLATFAERSNKA